ncbi:MAG: long-chain fatty acid--CoA ligase [Firmicutes bacterium]|nr:long-chain fatty acid--CoA ligase [Bacillota bacterium]
MDSTNAELPWSRSYDREVPMTLSYPEQPVFELFLRSARDNPDRTALLFFGTAMSYSRLKRHVESMVSALADLGIGRGCRVALLLPNSPQYVISYYSIMMTGATVVPMNPLNTETELMYILRDGGVRAVVALDLFADRVESVRRKFREAGEPHLLEHVYYTSLREFMPFPLKQLYPLSQKLPPGTKEHLSGSRRFIDLIRHSPRPYKPPEVDIYKDEAVLIYTGGTTGRPKGVMLSHRALVVNPSHGGAWVQVTPEDRLLTVLPVFHGFGMSVCMNLPVIYGASMVLLPRFNVREVLRAIHRYRPTLFAGVPTMYIGLINHPELSRYDLSSLRGCFAGASALAPEVKRRFEELTGGRLMEGYGLTEAVTAKCCNPFRGANKTGSIGVPFPDTVMRVVDLETGETEMPPGEIGEFVLQSPDMMLGYYNRPEENASAVRNGWLHTGDLGYMDEDGYFFMVDRLKDLIITGGFNVYPREVEDVLHQHPAVRETSVIGVRGEFQDEVVKAFVTLKDGCAADPGEIIRFCRQHLVPYKVPRQVEICPDLPKSIIGKILKQPLREQSDKTAAL